MIWEDERYVRIYTRDTATLLRLGWEGRAVLWELTRKVDRAGILRVEEPVADLAAILRMPEDVVERGLTALMSGKSPTVLLQEGAVVIPKFLEAQEARQSDRQRKADQRAKARDVAAARSVVADETEPHAVTKRDSESQNVTDCPLDGQKVTNGHTESHAVTSGHSVPYRTVPCLTVPDRAVPTGPDKKSEPSAPRGASVEALVASITWPLGMKTPGTQSALTAWSRYRRKAKKPIGADTLEAILEKYNGRPAELERDVKHSIAMGWTGLFAADSGNGSGRGPPNPAVGHFKVTNDLKYESGEVKL